MHNSSNTNNQKGFTIVELLIVIVVIAILAAITIVAYNGIQNRGKTAAGQSLANSIVKKAEAYNTIKSAYPTMSQLTTTDATAPEAKVDDASSMTATTLTAALANGGKTVQYATCAAGSNVSYWDYTTNGATIMKAGAGC